MSTPVYIRLKKTIILSSLKSIQLRDIAYISTSSSYKREIEETAIYQLKKEDNNIVIIDGFIVIDHLNRKYKDELDFQIIGPAQMIIRIEEKKKKPSLILFSFVWILLFIGAAMTIINFHYDVSMQEVQQKVHFLITGEKVEHPLWMQIPYSLGLGVGMLLFLNFWFKKRFNDEPSPLEVELFNYQQDINNYLSHYENKLNDQDPLL